MLKTTIRIIAIIGFIFITQSCEKLIEVDPPIDQQIGQSIFDSDINAASVLTGLYTRISSFNFDDMSMRLGLASDELETNAPPNSILSLIYTNSISKEGNQLFWTSLYEYIFRINSAIEGITSSKGLSSLVKQRLLGEAKFLRAFIYFHIVNLYGRAPLITTTDAKINATKNRDDIDAIYELVISDLKDAKFSLSDEYLSANITTTTAERLRPNKSVASALLARIYLYRSMWQNAEQEATEVINKTEDYRLVALDSVFLKNSLEAIWQLQPVDLTTNTKDAMLFYLKPSSIFSQPGPDGEARPVYLNNNLYTKFSADDKRKDIWTDSVIVNGITYPFAFKYKVFETNQPLNEYIMVLRLAEQYLIRAEARLRQNKNTGLESSISDLNTIRARAGLSSVNTNTDTEIFTLIMDERQRELFTEWGHRWFDLKRTNLVDIIMPPITASKGGQWASFKALYPIPISDIKNNPSFQQDQNPGYPAF
ncbi:RagB/SusD family nutrient uptake outer membrane protein [Chitinophaga rhizophila]|uniref:RagB/SusD family nutrient uptake outer membrane protein n=1 Tax=Chitinophaga rhizophila TaxID=2866212 RepID=A0ABS7GAB3_9BACT|nr:RagB/SusD family nutrient uptake outer membrane protein [Chitinophaga rhizophila]MBW8683473.1 RagB/SusD family nutrient uptake outer membrane protein [Chitinophaga rhizophila]